MVIAMLAVIAGLGLIIDGGNAWAQQRITQAGNDASAEAGADGPGPAPRGRPRPRRPGGTAPSRLPSRTAAAKNGVTVEVAYYTDICGTLLRPDGTKASGHRRRGGRRRWRPADEQQHEPGLPRRHRGPGRRRPGDGGAAVQHLRLGRRRPHVVHRQDDRDRGQRPAPGHLRRRGRLHRPAAHRARHRGHLRDERRGREHGRRPGRRTPGSSSRCARTTPATSAGSTGRPRAAAQRSSRSRSSTPNNPPIDLPSWNYVTQTGDPNSKMVEDALNTYMGQIVLFPLFDLTCGEDPGLRPDQGRPGLRLRRRRRQRLQPVVPLPGVRRLRARGGLRQRQQQARLRHGQRRHVMPDRRVRGLHHGRAPWAPASAAAPPTAPSSERS